jgi:hypothetical protein
MSWLAPFILAAFAFAAFPLGGRTPVFPASFRLPPTLAAPFAGERVEAGDELSRLVETIALPPARHLLLLKQYAARAARADRPAGSHEIVGIPADRSAERPSHLFDPRLYLCRDLPPAVALSSFRLARRSSFFLASSFFPATLGGLFAPVLRFIVHRIRPPSSSPASKHGAAKASSARVARAGGLHDNVDIKRRPRDACAIIE